ncbi:hypothetical protein BST61_g4081 [Cercospora zeina]
MIRCFPAPQAFETTHLKGTKLLHTNDIMSVNATTTILSIFRAIIYEYVFEIHWEEHPRHVWRERPSIPSPPPAKKI